MAVARHATFRSVVVRGLATRENARPHGPGPTRPARDPPRRVPRYRYVPFSGYSGTAVRDLVFREAEADVVCCVDSHVLLGPGALAALRDWFGAHPGSPPTKQTRSSDTAT